MNINKFIGSSLMIVGTMVGAGMLALPMLSAKVGFTIAAIMLVAMWAFTTLTALLILEVNLAFEGYSNSLGSMAFKTLGIPGKTTSWLCILILLYALTAAYISGSIVLLPNVVQLVFHIEAPEWINAVIFLTVMGGVVFWSTSCVDYCNRLLIGFKGLLLLLTFSLLLPQINFLNIVRSSHDNKCLLSMLPIFLCSFGFHAIIPSLSNYIGHKPRELKLAIICGSSTTLIIYLLWLFATMGVVPWVGPHSFTSITQPNGHILIKDFIKNIYETVDNKWMTVGINGFANIAMTTSFLGVTLGLFDFLADGFKRPNTRSGRFQTSLLTFIPPLIFALFFPNGFILALEFAALFATIIIVILPALMAYKLRSNTKLSSPYRVFGGKYLLFSVMAIGILMFCTISFSLFAERFMSICH
jgi:aromatic amino acid transport protein